MSDLVFRTTSTDRTVIATLIEAAHKHGMGRVALEDPVTGTLTYRKLLLGTAILGRKLMPLADEGGCIGVMLPNANGAAVATFAADVGRARAGDDQLLRRRSECALGLQGREDFDHRHVAGLHRKGATRQSDRRHPQRRETPLSRRRPHRHHFRRQAARYARGKTSPRRAPARRSGGCAVHLRPEGTPKGVVLSNRNILANVAQAEARIDFGRRDTLFNVLPLFHSFGLTIGLILPLCTGVRVFLYPSPLHYRIVPEMVYGTNATIMFGTDTFLSGYARSAHPYDFRSLRYLLAGAEPVRETTRRTYLEKFGLRILEGYGVTETAPALALNTPMFNKFGTVGRLLPGHGGAARAGGRDRREAAVSYVRGPNVMLGYYRVENPGVLERPAEGWHDTGDIVTIDADGFITIKGRAKRFAKLAGEMISLAAVEQLAAELWPAAMSGCATAPDAAQGRAGRPCHHAERCNTRRLSEPLPNPRARPT